MSIETISYIVTFILTAGISALGILLSVQLYQQFKKPVLSVLLYQQIFLFSFLVYSIWGNIILRNILADIQMSAAFSEKLAVFVPMIGIPFMVVSWFMLLRFALNINGINNTKKVGFIFFPTLVVLFFLLDFLIYRGIISIPADADLFIVRILVAANVLVHLVFLSVFLKPAKIRNESGFGIRQASLFLITVLLSSAVMSFFNYFGFISICVSVLLVFISGAFLPVYLHFFHGFTENKSNMNFDAFCTFYEISKREAEIILEICNGMSNKAIADKLFITLQTVKDHNHRIFTKTGVKSRVQLSNLVLEKTRKKMQF